MHFRNNLERSAALCADIDALVKERERSRVGDGNYIIYGTFPLRVACLLKFW